VGLFVNPDQIWLVRNSGVDGGHGSFTVGEALVAFEGRHTQKGVFAIPLFHKQWTAFITLENKRHFITDFLSKKVRISQLRPKWQNVRAQIFPTPPESLNSVTAE